MQPVEWLASGQSYFEDLAQAQNEAVASRQAMTAMMLKAHEAERLHEQNQQLRDLLQLRPRLTVDTVAAGGDVRNPESYTRRVVLDKGQVAGIEAGSPVLDDLGVLGQVTRVQPFSSEVTLLSDRDQAIPVMVARTGVRSVAYGDASNLRTDSMELRFLPTMPTFWWAMSWSPAVWTGCTLRGCRLHGWCRWSAALSRLSCGFTVNRLPAWMAPAM